MGLADSSQLRALTEAVVDSSLLVVLTEAGLVDILVTKSGQTDNSYSDLTAKFKSTDSSQLDALIDTGLADRSVLKLDRQKVQH